MKTIFKTILFLYIVTFSSCKKGVDDIILEAESSSFIIYTYDEYGCPSGSGSGFFINESGVGITNYHVLDGATKAILITSDSSKYEIEKIISADSKKDVLKFQIKNAKAKTFSTLKFSNVEPRKGDKVYCISNPLGLENTFAEGVVSAIRNNKKNGKIIQFSAPISPGSSGGAILNDNGDVIALATFQRRNGQNLNFGTYINDEILNSITEDAFTKKNPKFSKRDKFIILNLKSDNDPFEVLNAIEFGENSTTLYMSFTNTHLPTIPSSSWAIYQNFDKKKEESLCLSDLKYSFKYYIVSSSLGNQENSTVVPLGTTIKYKQFLPKINTIPKTISIEEPNDSRAPRWSNINLEDYENLDKFDLDKFQNTYALSALKEGELANAQSIFLEILDKDPQNIEALNILGVLSYALDNKSDAIYYFSQAIEVNPNTPVSYVNRHLILKSQNNIQAALNDICKAITISPDQPDFYRNREKLYLILGDIEKARKDFFAADDIYAKDFNRKPWRSFDADEERIYNYILSLREEGKLE
jgi:serine protease Do